MKTNPYGSGYIVGEGFTRRGETGYALRENTRGCLGTWPGYFRDSFNYTAHSSGHDTTFGSYWNVTPDFGATYALDADKTGYLRNTGSAPPDGLWPSCSSIPIFGNQYAELVSTQNGTTSHPTGSTPLFAGGPACCLNASGKNGYTVTAYNEFLVPASDFTHSFWVVLQGTDTTSDALVKYKQLTGGSGFNSSGWRTASAKLRIEATSDAVHSPRIKVYLDGAVVIDYTIPTAGYPNSGRIGIWADTACKLSSYIAGGL